VAGPGKILVCGTNAYKPRCRTYHLSANGHYSQAGGEKTGQGICPYDPRHNSTSSYVGKSFIVENGIPPSYIVSLVAERKSLFIRIMNEQ
jgi:hypothetical protein